MHRVQDVSAEVHAGSVRQNTRLTSNGFGRLPLYFSIFGFIDVGSHRHLCN